MSSTTSKLGLIKPELIDEIHQTIVDINNNFQKIDDEWIPHFSDIPTSGDWVKDQKIWFTDAVSKGYVGAINTRTGKAAPKWASLNQYNIGDKVVPTEDNGHWYECIQPGYSAPTEPIWPTTSQGTVEDLNGVTTWLPSTYYNINDIVVPPVPNDRFYVCVTPGTSGPTEPVWETTEGIAFNDNEVVWLTYRIVKWREGGTSALFKFFGKIES